MTKDSKTVSTIRRRKGKQVALALQKIREDNPKPALASEEEITAAEVEDKCYLFDDRVLGPMTLRRLMSNNSSLFLALLACRCANALLIQTQYVPDEYWQSLEVAHNMVFGYGYLTWEWREGLRGYTFPLLFAVFYKILYILGLDSRVMLIKGPRLIQGFISAWGDLHLYKLSSKLSGRATAQWTLLCQMMSWFAIYCSTRTLSNSFETSLVVAALSYFPWPDSPSKPKDVYRFLLLASLTVIIRPTAALIWLLLCSWHLQRVYKSPAYAGILTAYAFVGTVSLSLSAIVDRIWYGQWTFVQLNFLVFNVVQGGANIYGVHPWHWYFSQGFPVVMGTLLIPFIMGAWQAKNKALLWVILWIIGTLSFLPHKEFRFVMPALPLAMHYCGAYFQSLCSKPSLKPFKPKKKDEQKSTSDTSEELSKDVSDSAEAENDDAVVSVSDHQSLQSSNTSSGIAGEKEGSSRQGSQIDKDSDEQTDEKSRLKEDKVKSDLLEKDVKHAGDVGQVEQLAEVGGAKGKTEGSEKSGQAKEAVETSEDQGLGPGKENELKDSNLDKEMSPEVLRDRHHLCNLLKAKIFTVLLAVTNFLPAFYFCLIHQRGTVMVTKFLYEASSTQPDMDVLFLMPCHSTPYYSYIHKNISMRFLTCEPNLRGVSNYTDEADIFYQDPKEWLRQEYAKSKTRWPSHIVYFSTLHKDIRSTLTQSGYKLCENFFHTHLPEGRVGSSVLVSCR